MQALTSSTFRTPTTHIPPAAYPSWLPTPTPPSTHILPAAYPSGLPTPPYSYPSCSLSFWAPYPPTHIPPAVYPSGLPNPRPLLPMNALEESLTEILQCP